MKEIYSLIGDEYLSEDLWSTVEITSGTREKCENALLRLSCGFGFGNGQYMNCKVVKQKDVLKHSRTYEW